MYHYAEVVLAECDAPAGSACASTCGGKNALWKALKSEAAKGEYVFQSALQGEAGVDACCESSLVGAPLGGLIMARLTPRVNLCVCVCVRAPWPYIYIKLYKL